MNCKICQADAKLVFNKKLLFKYDISYFHCSSCGLLFTEDPYWLDEAYDEDLKGIRDTGMVQRNLALADITSRLTCDHFDAKGQFVDYGAGTGLFVRMMRDRGFDYYYDDPFARNIFARCFEAALDSDTPGQYELLTAIEVFEHSPDPVADVKRMLEYSDSILFTTELQPDDKDELEDWFYLLPDAGQHVTFYTMASLECLAEKFSMKLYSDGATLHLMTRRDLNIQPDSLKTWQRSFGARVLAWLGRKLQALAGSSPSMGNLINQDAKLVNQLLKDNSGL